MELIKTKDTLSKLCLVLYKEGILNSFISSVSMRYAHMSFVINKNEILFSNFACDDFILLQEKKDYRWKEASKDALIHQHIYKNFLNAKFVCFCMPSYLSSYALEHSSFEPKDIFGQDIIDNIFIYDTKQTDDWSERAPSEIIRYFKQNNTNIMILKDCGVCIYTRSFCELVKSLITLENSAKLLSISKNFSS